MEFRERLHVFLACIDAFLNLSDLFELESLETLFKVIPLLLAQKHLMFTTYHSVVTNFQTRKLSPSWLKVRKMIYDLSLKRLSAFPNLKGIDISNNMLDEIPAEVFQLSDWRVSGNNIGCISLETIEEGFRPHSNFKDEL